MFPKKKKSSPNENKLNIDVREIDEDSNINIFLIGSREQKTTQKKQIISFFGCDDSIKH